MYLMKDTLYNTGRKVIDYFALSDLENIERIHCRTWGAYIDDVILPLLNSSVKSLYLLSERSQRGSWSRCLVDKVNSLQKLEAIGICGFEMSHSDLRCLLDFISQRDCLREIELEFLFCTGHRSSCTGYDLLLANLSLRKLTLSKLKLSKIIINMASLENCKLISLYNQDLVLEFLNCADNKLNTFDCCDTKSSAAIDEMVRMLRESQHVRKVDLREINLGRRNLTLSPKFGNIESLRLLNVPMEASACRELVGSVLKLKQTVAVDIVNCTISPREEFETLKAKVKTSQCVRITRDRKDWFRFEKIKDGD